MAIDLDALHHAIDDQLGRDRVERRRARLIVGIHERFKSQGEAVSLLLLELEKLYGARVDHVIDIALGLGIRAGQAEMQAADLDDDAAELLRELAFMGLNLPKLNRLQVIAEMLKLDLSTAEGVFDR